MDNIDRELLETFKIDRSNLNSETVVIYDLLSIILEFSCVETVVQSCIRQNNIKMLKDLRKDLNDLRLKRDHLLPFSTCNISQMDTIVKDKKEKIKKIEYFMSNELYNKQITNLILKRLGYDRNDIKKYITILNNKIIEALNKYEFNGEKIVNVEHNLYYEFDGKKHLNWSEMSDKYKIDGKVINDLIRYIYDNRLLDTKFDLDEYIRLYNKQKMFLELGDNVNKFILLDAKENMLKRKNKKEKNIITNLKKIGLFKYLYISFKYINVSNGKKYLDINRIDNIIHDLKKYQQKRWFLKFKRKNESLIDFINELEDISSLNNTISKIEKLNINVEPWLYKIFKKNFKDLRQKNYSSNTERLKIDLLEQKKIIQRRIENIQKNLKLRLCNFDSSSSLKALQSFNITINGHDSCLEKSIFINDLSLTYVSSAKLLFSLEKLNIHDAFYIMKKIFPSSYINCKEQTMIIQKNIYENDYIDIEKSYKKIFKL